MKLVTAVSGDVQPDCRRVAPSFDIDKLPSNHGAQQYRLPVLSKACLLANGLLISPLHGVRFSGNDFSRNDFSTVSDVEDAMKDAMAKGRLHGLRRPHLTVRR